MKSTFAQLGVPDAIIGALSRRGITEPFEIQASTIADALAGRDVCGRAPTGSGKTLAFGIPLVVRATRSKPRRPGALVLAPTRELAEQIQTELRSFAGKTRIAAIYGGVGYGQQRSAMARGVDILVACPGRLEDLIQQKDVDLRDVKHVVLDEADRMADMGFMPAVCRLLDQTSNGRQTVLFSATLDGDVAKLTRRYQDNPVLHQVGEETPDITKASHVFWSVEKADRAATTAEAVDAAWPAIVFCRTRHGANRLTKQLNRAGIEAAAIHGGRTQNQRNRALDSFAKSKVHALVATDVAARGIHVDDVAAVVHYDPPEDHKAYVHRSGRTARAGKGGLVISLLQPDQMNDAKKLQRQLGLREPITRPDTSPLKDEPAPSSVSVPPPSERRLIQTRSAETSRKEIAKRGSKPRPGSRRPRKSRRGDGQAQGGGQASPKRPNRKARRAHLQRPAKGR